MQADTMPDSEQGRSPLRNLILMAALALAVGLGGGFLVFRQRAEHKVQPTLPSSSASSATAVESSQPTVSPVAVVAQYMVQPSSPEEMFSEFLCTCCGKPIGDCGCGMAQERKGFVTGQVSAGQNKLGVYLAYADEYGLDSFASEEVKTAIREYRLANAPAERPQILLAPQEVNLGEVSAKKGKLEISIIIENIGQKDLIVDSLSTSCACTTVSVVNNGQEGPMFGTDTPPEGWSTTIPPGKTAELRVYYDPNFHKDARGSMVREVYVSSNDPVDPVVKLRIELEQVD